MSKNDEKNISITLKSDEDDKRGVVLSFSAILKMIKRCFVPWIMIAILLGLLVFGISTAITHSAKPPLKALISFSFDGIEKGKDPNGNEFDVYTIKKPSVIEAALTSLNMPLEMVEEIRQNITVEGVKPADAIDRITVYKSIYESGSNVSLSAADKMLETEYYPTQFTVTFNYAKTDISSDDAVQVLNAVLNCYRDYFFKTYGYNEALGSAVTATDYSNYDYAEVIDIYSDTLTTIQKYVGELSKNDTTRFRSSITGYTFADLSESIKAIQSIDLDMISSYITINNVTKDKDVLLNYYKFRIQNLERSKVIYQEQLAAITETIAGYEKDSILIIGNGTDDINTNYTQASKEYDNLLEKKLTAQDNLSRTTQEIIYYNERITALNTTTVGSSDKVEKAEADLAKLNAKVANLIEQVNLTSNEYYETVSLKNAYNILVPASSSVGTSITSMIKSSIIPVLVTEIMVLVVYIGIAFVLAIVEGSRKQSDIVEAATEKASAAGGDGNDDEDKKD
ncbi:MAG: lipopolysaccharide biosynthesis protein [Ruminococcus sp.]